MAHQAAPDSRARILHGAARRLATHPRATVGDIAAEAGVSRATLYRYFGSRGELLQELELEPHPGTDELILAAAAVLVGRDGLRNLTMDELAATAGVSRASVYRLFPGKAALFSALVRRYSPFETVEWTLSTMRDESPEDVLPEVARAVARTMEARIGIARSLLFEVTSGTPDAIEGAVPVIRQMLESLGGYLAAQIARGRLRPMHPFLAAQALIGPVFFHLMTRPLADQVAHLKIPVEQAVTELAEAAVRGLRTEQPREARR